MHLPNLVDYKFTADMEDELDAISRGELGYLEYLGNFYFGKGTPGLKELVKTKIGEIDAREVCQVFIGKPDFGKEEIFTSASAAMAHFFNKVKAEREFPTKRRPMN